MNWIGEHFVVNRGWLLLAASLVPFIGLCQTQSDDAEKQPVIKDQQIAGPANPADFSSWIKAMKAWRTQQLRTMSYDGSNYAKPEFQWIRKAFVQPQTMVEDRYLYDPKTRRYTVSRYLNDLIKRYGGVDAVLIWPTYPNIGVDDRNTDDMFRSMPGGIPGIRQMVQDFHRAGVKVLFPIHPWDVGTRDPERSWGVVLPHTMAEIRADGLNGDTMYAVTSDYLENAIADKNPLVLQPEIGLTGQIEQLGWNLMSWGYWDTDDAIPMVSKNKWLEPRHMVNICDRWSTDKTKIIQDAFFNGTGVETWENIWGIWNGLSDRDCEAIRRVAAIERQFSDLLVSPEWEPHTPVLQGKYVFASKWPNSKSGKSLWTIINRSDSDIVGPQLELPVEAGTNYYDIWNGVRLNPDIEGDRAVLSFPIEAHGYGAVLVCKGTDSNVDSFLVAMRRHSRRPLAGFSSQIPILKQAMTPIPETAPASGDQPGMVKIPAAQFNFGVKGIEIEGEDMVGLDVQYPWENEPRRSHSHTVDIDSFYMDRYPVTNAEFKQFLEASHYKPEDKENFLKDWHGGSYPTGWGEKPVTWVSLEDARTYAAWAGKRLPHEWEWQYAAGGLDGRVYPWGNEWDDSKVAPTVKSRTLTPAPDVTASTGASPFGVMDLVGNVWQYTDEFTDEHTRAVVLRGGSRYQPQGSSWYFPQAYRLDQHGKYLLMSPGRDRSGAIGFRCVKDCLER